MKVLMVVILSGAQSSAGTKNGNEEERVDKSTHKSRDPTANRPSSETLIYIDIFDTKRYPSENC